MVNIGPTDREVKPIAQLITELRDLLVKGLPKKHFASWSILGEAESLIAESRYFFRADEEGRAVTDEGYWIATGKRYAADRMIRKLADAHKVSNFNLK